MKNCSLSYVTQTKAAATGGGPACGVRRNTQVSVFPATLRGAQLAFVAVALLGFSGAEAQAVPANGARISWNGPYYYVDGTPCPPMDHYTIFAAPPGKPLALAGYVAGSQHTFTMTNLTPGTWTFEIEAVSTNGLGSKATAPAYKYIP